MRMVRGLALNEDPAYNGGVTCSLYESAFDRFPRRASEPWGAFAERFAHRVGPKEGPAWSPACYPPGLTRANANVEAVSCWALDIDDGWSPEEARRRLESLGLEYILHSSHSHGAVPKYRIIVPAEGPLTPERFALLYPGVVKLLADGHADPQTKDPARLFFLPRHNEGAPYFVSRGHGRPLPISLIPQTEEGRGDARRAVSVGGTGGIVHVRRPWALPPEQVIWKPLPESIGPDEKIAVGHRHAELLRCSRMLWRQICAAPGDEDTLERLVQKRMAPLVADQSFFDHNFRATCRRTQRKYQFVPDAPSPKRSRGADPMLQGRKARAIRALAGTIRPAPGFIPQVCSRVRKDYQGCHYPVLAVPAADPETWRGDPDQIAWLLGQELCRRGSWLSAAVPLWIYAAEETYDSPPVDSVEGVSRVGRFRARAAADLRHRRKEGQIVTIFAGPTVTRFLVLSKDPTSQMGGGRFDRPAPVHEGDVKWTVCGTAIRPLADADGARVFLDAIITRIMEHFPKGQAYAYFQDTLRAFSQRKLHFIFGLGLARSPDKEELPHVRPAGSMRCPAAEYHAEGEPVTARLRAGSYVPLYPGTTPAAQLEIIQKRTLETARLACEERLLPRSQRRGPPER